MKGVTRTPLTSKLIGTSTRRTTTQPVAIPWNDIDRKSLAQWCQRRLGWRQVCENDGATWLPFKPLCNSERRFEGAAIQLRPYTKALTGQRRDVRPTPEGVIAGEARQRSGVNAETP